MIIKSRMRAIITPLVLYAFAGAGAAFFIHHAHSGDRGLESKMSLKAEALSLQTEIDKLKSIRVDWERRIAMLRNEAVDRDLLEERARVGLGYGHRNDVVIVETLDRSRAN